MKKGPGHGEEGSNSRGWRDAALALLIGWLTVFAGLSAYWWYDSGALLGYESRNWSATQLQTVGGKSAVGHGALNISELSRDTSSQAYLVPLGRAVVTTGRIQVAASDYAFAICQCDQLPVDARLSLFWRRANDPDELHNADVESGPGGAIRSLADAPAWSGSIVELGIALQGPVHPGAPIEINGLQLRADSLAMRVRSLLADWAVFQPWQGHSINFLHLEADYTAVRIVPLAALATLLSALLFLAFRRSISLKESSAGLVLILVVGWLPLDLRWMVRLVEQNQQTIARFAGLGLEQSREQSLDAPLYRFATSVRSELGAPPKRVFVVTDEPSLSYLNYRLVYHLLPHRVFNFKRRFNAMLSKVRSGDFVLVLGSPPQVHFRKHAGMLQWSGRGTLAVERKLVGSIGTLYRVRAEP